MRKRLLFLSIAIMLVCLTNCTLNKSKQTKDNTININLWHYYSTAQKNALDTAITEFNETIGLEEGIHVEAKNQGSIKDLENKILESASFDGTTQEIPDIFTTYSDLAFIMDSKNKLANIEDYLMQSEIDEYVDDYIEEGKLSYSSKIKVFPIAKATETLYVNETDLDTFLKDIGSNTQEYEAVTKEDLNTWEGISKVADVYYKWTDNKTPTVKNDGKSFFGIDSVANFIIISNAQLGIDILGNKDDKPDIKIDETVMKKIWDTYYKNMLSGRFAEYGRFRSDDVKTGDLLAYAGSTSGGKYFPTAVVDDNGQHDIKLLAMAYPKYKDGINVAIQQGAGMAVMKSEPPIEAAAVRFLRWFTDEKINTDFTVSSGYLPVKKSVTEYEKMEDSLKQLNKEIDDENSIKVLKVALNQIQTAQMYFVKSFEQSFDIRRIIEESMITATNKAYEKLKSTEEQNKEDILKSLCSDEEFQIWIQDLKTKLDSILQK